MKVGHWISLCWSWISVCSYWLTLSANFVSTCLYSAILAQLTRTPSSCWHFCYFVFTHLDCHLMWSSVAPPSGIYLDLPNHTCSSPIASLYCQLWSPCRLWSLYSTGADHPNPSWPSPLNLLLILFSINFSNLPVVSAHIWVHLKNNHYNTITQKWHTDCKCLFLSFLYLCNPFVLSWLWHCPYILSYKCPSQLYY